MKPDKFDYDSYHKTVERIISRTKNFALGKKDGFLPVIQWTIGNIFGKDCRYRENMLEMQLEGITETLQADTDWVPFLEPWHGVGVFAEAFGSPFEWRDDDAPWTYPFIDSIEKLKSLKKPSIDSSPMLNYILDTIRYFDKMTDGEIPVSATDTQSPFDTATLICDTTWFFTATHEYPDEVHHLLREITDLIIEFTLRQWECTKNPIMPGHNAWSHPVMKGIGISEDILAMVGEDFFNTFIKPYDVEIADKLGGIAIHSCGNWAHNFEVVKKLKGISQIDLTVSKKLDPNPVPPDKLKEAFRESSLILKVRSSPEDVSFMDTMYSGQRLIWQIEYDENPGLRQSYYDSCKRRFENAYKKCKLP